jgi:hypothetical protein
MSRAPALVFTLLVGLAIAAGTLLALDARPSAREEERAREFHRLVGGLGFGPTIDAGRCEFGFDPRLCPACSDDCGPIPGGLFFCPHHASSLLDYSPLPENDPQPGSARAR